MKKILITGANSYIGTSFEKYLKSNYPNDYYVSTVDMTDQSWRQTSFSAYDAVFHVAGIAHRKETKKNAYLYYDVNRDLTIKTAKKAKDDGVKQFVFLSSMGVYGMQTGVITSETVPCPKSNYGKSKLEAEKGLLQSTADGFAVCIIRPPMVYGKGCKGNYPVLAKAAQKLPIFPYVKNERSMLYIENLCEFVRLMIDSDEQGTFWPQNMEYVNTSKLVQTIASAHGKKIRLVKGFTWALKIMSCMTPLVNKAFGSLCYAKEISEYIENYRVVPFEQSVYKTEK